MLPIFPPSSSQIRESSLELSPKGVRSDYLQGWIQLSISLKSGLCQKYLAKQKKQKIAFRPGATNPYSSPGIVYQFILRTFTGTPIPHSRPTSSGPIGSHHVGFLTPFLGTREKALFAETQMCHIIAFSSFFTSSALIVDKFTWDVTSFKA